MSLDRLEELAATSEDKVLAVITDWASFFDEYDKKQAKDLGKQVQALLDSASNEGIGSERWKASLLRFSAKHHLRQNDLAGACEDYAAAFETCQKSDSDKLTAKIALEGNGSRSGHAWTSIIEAENLFHVLA